MDPIPPESDLATIRWPPITNTMSTVLQQFARTAGHTVNCDFLGDQNNMKSEHISDIQIKQLQL